MGKIYFLLVRIKIKHMELSIIRRETTGTREYQAARVMCNLELRALTTRFGLLLFIL